MLSSILSSKVSCNIAQETLEVLRLIRSENVGNKTFFELIKIFGTAKEAIKHVEEMSLRGGRNKPIKLYSSDQAIKELKKASSMGVKMITYCDKSYPALLKHIPDHPPLISVLGRSELLNTPAVAIVGARNCSIAGSQLASRIAQEISKAGVTIVSGFARGIDTAAHNACLDTATIAVFAGGIDHIYPQENHELYHKIAKQGCIIAELPIGASPSSQHFPQRNRIISGLSLATVVIEASLGSGSLITARLALEQGREVFAVPGFPADPRYKGNNKLLKEGAMIVESAQDVLNNLPNFELKKACSVQEELPFYDMATNSAAINDNLRKQITNMLSNTPVDTNLLIMHSKLPINIVQLVLLELELAGKLLRHPGNKVSILQVY